MVAEPVGGAEEQFVGRGAPEGQMGLLLPGGSGAAGQPDGLGGCVPERLQGLGEGQSPAAAGFQAA